MLPAFPELEFFSLTLQKEFRGVRTREGILLAGPSGWGEFSPFPNYAPIEDSLWLRAALESAFVPIEFPQNRVRVSAPSARIVTVRTCCTRRTHRHPDTHIQCKLSRPSAKRKELFQFFLEPQSTPWLKKLLWEIRWVFWIIKWVFWLQLLSVSKFKWVFWTSHNSFCNHDRLRIEVRLYSNRDFYFHVDTHHIALEIPM